MHLFHLLLFVDAHQNLQKFINEVLTGLVGLLALAPLINRQALSNFSFLRKPWLFIALIAISLFSCRYPAFFYPGNLNPDEAQMLAQAITYEKYPIPWLDVDGVTSGPINSYVLLWTFPFGIQPNYLTSRIMELFCVLGMLIFLYHAGRRVAGDLAARLALMPVFLFLCWNALSDFVHYSSESVSIFLIGWALWLVIKLRRIPRIPSVIVLGLILGLLPFAKLQSTLLGGFLGLTAIGILLTGRRDARLAHPALIGILVTSAIVPGLLILSVVASFGALGDFWQSYIHFAQVYIVHYDSFSERLVGNIATIAWFMDPCADIAIILILVSVSTLVACLHLLFGLQKISRVARNWFVWAILFALVSTATLLSTGQRFKHYEFFLLPAFTFLIAIIFRLIGLGRRPTVFPQIAVPLLLAALLSSPLITPHALFPHHELYLAEDKRTIKTFGLLLLWLMGLSVVSTGGWLLVQRAFKTVIPPVSLVPWQRYLPFACLIPFFIIPEKISLTQPNPFKGKVKTYVAQPLPPMDLAILRDRPPGARLAIWGWAAEFAAETHTAVGTRDAVACNAICPSSVREYFRQRYLRDLRAVRPALFLEAAGPHNFGVPEHQVYGIKFFPELAKLISDQYCLDQEIDGMRLFIRRDLAKAESPVGTGMGK